MKKLTIILPIATLAIVCLLQACVKKETPSRVVEIGYPTVTLNGPADTTISRSASWVDPGASWTDSVTHESGTLTVSVNTSVDSAYVLMYKAVDKNGFSSFVTRALGVTNMSNAIDISGGYVDQYHGDTIPVQKVSRALFMIPNIDGFQDVSYMVIKSDSTISIATIIEQGVTAPGANLPNYFRPSLISYAAPITFSSTDSITNVPSFPILFVHE